MNKLLSINLVLVALFLATGAQTHKPYKWTDNEGNVHYSQHPPRGVEGVEYERMKIKTQRGTPSPESSAGEADSSSKPKSSSGSKLVEDELAKNKEIREQNCEAAKKNLRIYTIYKRYKDPEGNMRYLTEKERQKKIDETKEQVDEFCN